MKLKYFSLSSFQVTTDNGQILLIDPFSDDNPTSPVSSDDISADDIILTHGHGDHIGDSFNTAKRCGPLFICVNELANYCAEKGFRAHNMHIGGAHLFDFCRSKFTNAHHGSMTPDKTFPVIEADPTKFANKVVANGFKAQSMDYGEEILL